MSLDISDISDIPLCLYSGISEKKFGFFKRDDYFHKKEFNFVR